MLGKHAGRYTLILSLEYDDKGPLRLVVDVEAYRARTDKSVVEEVIDAAIEEAIRVFEEKTGLRVGKKVRRRR